MQKHEGDGKGEHTDRRPYLRQTVLMNRKPSHDTMSETIIGNIGPSWRKEFAQQFVIAAYLRGFYRLSCSNLELGISIIYHSHVILNSLPISLFHVKDSTSRYQPACQ